MIPKIVLTYQAFLVSDKPFFLQQSKPPPSKTATSLASPSPYTSIFLSHLPGLPLPMKHPHPTVAYKYFTLLSLCTFPLSYVSGCSSTPPTFSSSSDSLRSLQWNVGCLQARRAEVHLISSHPVDLIFIQESNLNSSFFPYSWILCSDLAVLLPMTHTPLVVSSFSSCRAHFSLNSIFYLSSVDPYS